MTEPLSGQFARQGSDAVLTGDRIKGREVVHCFVCTHAGGTGTVDRSHDRAVVVDDHTKRERVIGLEAAKEQRTETTGPRPVLRLPSARVAKPTMKGFHDRVMEGISTVTVDMWRAGSRVEEPVIKTLDQVAKDGYDIWVVGGSVRDAVREGITGTADPNRGGDLDLVGSLPPGCFGSGMREMVGRAELPIQFNPFSGVVAVSKDASRTDRLLEYASLKSDAREDNSLAFGCDLEADASWRDLTVNTLAYDWRSELLVDPTGKGLDDLSAMVLRPPAQPKSWPGFRAHLLFRYFKFARRWPDASTSALGRLIEREFTQFREDMRMLPDSRLQGLLKPFGSSPKSQVECVVALAKKLAPSCDWDGMFAASPRD